MGEQREQYEQRRAVVAALIRAVMGRLSADDGKPSIGDVVDNQRWYRHGQEDFIGIRSDAWRMPDYVPIYGWLDTFPEMAAVRTTYVADPVFGPRVDTLLGTEFGRQARMFDWLLIEHVLQPIVRQTGAYHFDEAVFDQVYRAFERGFGAKQVHMVEVRPLNGFTSTETAIVLPDGLVLRPMSDLEVSEALRRQAVPRMNGGGVNGARVSRFDQWALTVTQAYPVADGREISNPKAPTFPILDEPTDRLIKALRLVCGGSVVATRSMFGQVDDEFPIAQGHSAILNAFDSADHDRPTYLLPDQLDDLRAAYNALAVPTVTADRSLRVAVRRFVAAGGRRVEADRLIDLTIAAEALFIEQDTERKRAAIAAGAAMRLVGVPDVAASGAQIRRFMETAYQARNLEIHTRIRTPVNLHRLDGTPADSMPHILEDLEKIMRHAILAVLAEHAAAVQP